MSSLAASLVPEVIKKLIPYQSARRIGGSGPVLAVRGADEAIDLLIRTFCQPGKDKIVVCPPTYAMYEFCADALAMETIKVPLVGDAFELDCQGVIQAAKEANLVFLCSPNNPTGNLISQAEIVKVLEGTQDDAIVVVDEAYIEFEMEHNAASLIAQYPNLVVIRTLSKAFGLAAVRCGFIIADLAMHCSRLPVINQFRVSTYTFR